MRSAKACALGLLAVTMLWPISAGTAPWAVLKPDIKPDFRATQISITAGEARLLTPHAGVKPQLVNASQSLDSPVQSKSPVFSYGLTYWQEEQYDMALETFGALVHDKNQIKSARVRAAVWSARAAQKLGQKKVSKAYLEQAVKIYPAHFYGQFAAHKLRRDVPFNVQSYPVLSENVQKSVQADLALVHAIIKQESRFNPKASSPAGALGLMQVMPNTALHIDRVGYKSSEQLHDESYNVRLGSTYVRDLAQDKSINKNLYLTLAAYNNGPHSMKKWLAKSGEDVASDPFLIIETYPVGETRLFIKNVIANMWIYDRILNKRDSASLEQLSKQF